MALVTGYTKVVDLGPLASHRLADLEKTREHLAGILRTLLDPAKTGKLGRWSPHYLPTLRDLLAIEMQIDGFKYALDLEHTE